MPQRWLRSTAPPGTDVRSSYDGIVSGLEPTVLWRLQSEGRHARAVLLPGTPHVTLTFFVDNVMDRAENFDSMDIALFRSEDVKRTLITDGWCEDI